jgi:UDP-2,3-diacylglucosamine hydrolase
MREGAPVRPASSGPEDADVTTRTEAAEAGSGGQPVNRDAPVYLVADAHLGIEADSLESAKVSDLLALIGHLEGRSSVLYLVGDIFDFWFEYPWSKPTEHGDVTSALLKLTRSGTEVHFLGGNHDYWAGRHLAELTGAAVHRTPVTTTHFGKRVFIAHGDGLPEGDRRYKALKAVLRNPIAIAGFMLIPARIGAALGRWASNLSEISEERIDSAVPAMARFLDHKLTQGFDVVAVAHIHKQMMWASGGGTAVVVGDWMKHRSVVELSERGVRTLAWSDGALVEEHPDRPESRASEPTR